MDQERRVNFSVIKQKIIKTDEILHKYLEANNKLRKSQNMCKEMKLKYDQTALNLTRFQLENERCSFSLENIKSSHGRLEQENKELREQIMLLEEKYNQQTVQSQSEIKRLADELKMLEDIKKYNKTEKRMKDLEEKSKNEKETRTSNTKEKAKLHTENKKLSSDILIAKESYFETIKQLEIENNNLLQERNRITSQGSKFRSNMEKTCEQETELIILKREKDKEISELQQKIFNLTAEANKLENIKKESEELKQQLLDQEMVLFNIKHKRTAVDICVQTDPFSKIRTRTVNTQTSDTMKTYQSKESLSTENKKLKQSNLDYQAEIIKLKAVPKVIKINSFTQTEQLEPDESIDDIMREMCIPIPKMLSPIRPSPYDTINCENSKTPILTDDKNVLLSSRSSEDIPQIIITPPTPILEKDVKNFPDFHKNTEAEACLLGSGGITQHKEEQLTNSELLTKHFNSEDTVTDLRKNYKRQKYRPPLIGNNFVKLKKGYVKLPLLLNKLHVLRQGRKRTRRIKRQDCILKALQTLKRSRINFTISNESTLPYCCTNNDCLINDPVTVPDCNLSRKNSPLKMKGFVPANKYNEIQYLTENLNCGSNYCANSRNSMSLRKIGHETELLGFFDVKNEITCTSSSRLDNKPSNFIKLFKPEICSVTKVTQENLLETLAELVSQKLREKSNYHKKKKKSFVSDNFNLFNSETETEIEKPREKPTHNILKRNKMLLKRAKELKRQQSESTTSLEGREINNKNSECLSSRPIVKIENSLETVSSNLNQASNSARENEKGTYASRCESAISMEAINKDCNTEELTSVNEQEDNCNFFRHCPDISSIEIVRKEIKSPVKSAKRAIWPTEQSKTHESYLKQNINNSTTFHNTVHIEDSNSCDFLTFTCPDLLSPLSTVTSKDGCGREDVINSPHIKGTFQENATDTGEIPQPKFIQRMGEHFGDLELSSNLSISPLNAAEKVVNFLVDSPVSSTVDKYFYNKKAMSIGKFLNKVEEDKCLKEQKEDTLSTLFTEGSNQIATKGTAQINCIPLLTENSLQTKSKESMPTVKLTVSEANDKAMLEDNLGNPSNDAHIIKKNFSRVQIKDLNKKEKSILKCNFPVEKEDNTLSLAKHVFSTENYPVASVDNIQLPPSLTKDTMNVSEIVEESKSITNNNSETRSNIDDKSTKEFPTSFEKLENIEYRRNEVKTIPNCSGSSVYKHTEKDISINMECCKMDNTKNISTSMLSKPKMLPIGETEKHKESLINIPSEFPSLNDIKQYESTELSTKCSAVELTIDQSKENSCLGFINIMNMQDQAKTLVAEKNNLKTLVATKPGESAELQFDFTDGNKKQFGLCYVKEHNENKKACSDYIVPGQHGPCHNSIEAVTKQILDILPRQETNLPLNYEAKNNLEELESPESPFSDYNENIDTTVPKIIPLDKLDRKDIADVFKETHITDVSTGLVSSKESDTEMTTYITEQVSCCNDETKNQGDVVFTYDNGDKYSATTELTKTEMPLNDEGTKLSNQKYEEQTYVSVSIHIDEDHQVLDVASETEINSNETELKKQSNYPEFPVGNNSNEIYINVPKMSQSEARDENITNIVSEINIKDMPMSSTLQDHNYSFVAEIFNVRAICLNDSYKYQDRKNIDTDDVEKIPPSNSLTSVRRSKRICRKSERHSKFLCQSNSVEGSKNHIGKTLKEKYQNALRSLRGRSRTNPIISSEIKKKIIQSDDHETENVSEAKEIKNVVSTNGETWVEPSPVSVFNDPLEKINTSCVGAVNSNVETNITTWGNSCENNSTTHLVNNKKLASIPKLKTPKQIKRKRRQASEDLLVEIDTEDSYQLQDEEANRPEGVSDQRKANMTKGISEEPLEKYKKLNNIPIVVARVHIEPDIATCSNTIFNIYEASNTDVQSRGNIQNDSLIVEDSIEELNKKNELKGKNDGCNVVKKRKRMSKLTSDVLKQFRIKRKMFQTSRDCVNTVNGISACDFKTNNLSKSDVVTKEANINIASIDKFDTNKDHVPNICNSDQKYGNKKIRIVQDILISPNSKCAVNLLEKEDVDNDFVTSCDIRLGSNQSSSQSGSSFEKKIHQKKLKVKNYTINNDIPVKKKRLEFTKPNVAVNEDSDVLSKIMSQMDKNKSTSFLNSDSKPSKVTENILTGITDKEWRKGIVTIAETTSNISTELYSLDTINGQLSLLPKKQLFSKKVKILMSRLLRLSTDEKIADEVILEFKRQKVEYIAEIILHKVSQDTDEKPDDKYFPAPLMTKMQRTFLNLMVQLEREKMDNLMDTFLSKTETFLFKRGCGIKAMVSVTRLYMAICRLCANINKMRTFCCNAILFMGDLAVPLLFTVLTSWTEVFPMEADLKNYPLAKVLVQVIYLKVCNKPGYNLLPLKLLLNQFYGYPKEKLDCDELFEELFQQYLRNPETSSGFALRVLCKNKETKWVYKKINEFLKPLVYKIPDENVNFKATVIILIGKICKQFKPKIELDQTYLTDLRRWLTGLVEEGGAPDLVERSVRFSLSALPKKKNVRLRKVKKEMAVVKKKKQLKRLKRKKRKCI